jgi:hypothetical protein
MSPAKEPFKQLLLKTPLWQCTMSMTHKSLPEGLLESEKGTLTIQLPIPYVPPIDLHKKRDIKQIKVKLPNGTNFQMSAFGQENNEEYLVHVIAVKCLLEQKGSIQDWESVWGHS